MWIEAGAILSAASCLAWIARLLGTSEADLLEPLGLRPKAPSPVSFLPYLSGERTPHDDPDARGMLDGLNHGTDRAAIVQAVLEGVAFAIADCRDALADTGIVIAEADAIGGGSRSRFWLSVLANVLNIPIHRFADGETGAAFGAARLARLAVTGEAIEAVCTPPRRDRDIRTRARARRGLRRAASRMAQAVPAAALTPLAGSALMQYRAGSAENDADRSRRLARVLPCVATFCLMSKPRAALQTRRG